MSTQGWVLVSGAGGILGNQLARHFAANGRKVAGLDLSFPDQADSPPSLDLVAMDLTSDAALREFFAGAAARYGRRLDLVVNSVGKIWNEPLVSFQGGRLSPHGLDSWRSAVEANLTAPFVVAKEAAAFMVRAGGGAIVNISSISAQGNAGQVAYSAAKAGVEGMTRCMARELGPMGVRVNALAPGFIDGPTTRANVEESRLKSYSEQAPMGRLGVIEDVISAVEYLATNTFVTGTVLPLDGGLRLP